MEHNPLRAGAESHTRSSFEEFTAAQKFFARGLMRVSGTHTVEEAQAADWRFDGRYDRYDARRRDPNSTNYQVITEKVIPEEGEEIKTVHEEEDDKSRRCTICHQPISYVNLIGVGGQIVPTGSDCTAKLLRFKETGEIVAENPRKEIWDEQSKILLDGAEYDEDVLKQSGEKRITKRKIIASMMSWLVDHMNEEGTPENVQYAIRSYNSVGLLPSKELAKELSDYYKSVRKFLPAEVLKNKDIGGLEDHPHHTWLKKIVGEGIVQEDIPQLERIIQKGRELEGQRYQRDLAERRKKTQEKWAKWHEEEERARAETAKQKAETEAKRKESMTVINELHDQGIVNVHKFESINFAADVSLARNDEGKDGLTRTFEEDLNMLRYYEIDEKDTVHVYELDQVPVYGYGNKPKHFVIVGVGEPEQIKLYPRSLVKDVAQAINKKEIPWEEGPVSQKAQELAPEATIVRYSCAQVIISRVTNEPVVLLKDGPMPLEQFLKEYKSEEVMY